MNIEKIVEEFDKLFGYEIKEIQKEYSHCLSHEPDIRNFLIKALTSHTKAIREEVEGMKDKYSNTGASCGDNYVNGKNNTIRDILNLEILKVK